MAESRSALLVVDVQNDVVVNAHSRDEIVRNIGSLVERARTEDVPVIWVQHADDELPAGTPGWEIVPELTVAEGEPVIHKHHRDAFDGTSLGAELEQRGVDRVVVTGSQTDFCVRWTLHGAHTRGYHATLVSDGHTTDDGGGELPTAAQLIAHTNRFWHTQSHDGHRADTAAAAEVVF